MIKLWGRASSANVQKIVWALQEMQLTYQRVDVGGKFGGVDDAAFLAMNPNGKVPVLQDGSVTLWESHAILRYLTASYGTGNLWPKDPAARALVDQWTDWVATRFQPAWIGLFWSVVRTPPDERDAGTIEKFQRNTDSAIAMLDARLAEMPYLAGDHLTYADIAAGVALYRWTQMDIARPKAANVAAWHQRLLQRPAFVKAVNVSYDELIGRAQS